MLHKLKILPEFYEQVINGNKTFELRKNDRNFKHGDTVRLQEWNPETKQYTTRYAKCLIRYCLYGGRYGLQEGYVILSIEVLDHYPAEVTT